MARAAHPAPAQAHSVAGLHQWRLPSRGQDSKLEWGTRLLVINKSIRRMNNGTQTFFLFLSCLFLYPTPFLLP